MAAVEKNSQQKVAKRKSAETQVRDLTEASLLCLSAQALFPLWLWLWLWLRLVLSASLTSPSPCPLAGTCILQLRLYYSLTALWHSQVQVQRAAGKMACRQTPR